MAATAVGAATARPLLAARRPNVIVVLADDQGYGDLSSQGHPEIRTPNLDRLRGESVRFTDFHSSPMCTPSRAQLLTGRDALITQAMNVSSGRTILRRDLPTLAETFRDNGYRTGLFGKWHLGDTYPYRPSERGFQEAVWYPSSHIGSVPDAWNNDYFNDSYRHNGHLQRYQGYSGDVFFEEAMRWMGGAGAAPFFCYLPLNVAHTPLFVPPKYVEPYKNLPEAVARYSGMIANIDDNVGRLDEMLRRSGLRENTVLIYLSDNGATGNTLRFNAGMRGTKAGLYEGGHRVPCFIRWPGGGVQGGRDVPDLTEFQDLYPTLIDLCGLKRPAGFQTDGASLAPILQGRAKQLPDRMLVVQFSRMPVGARKDARPRKDDAAVMWKTWRLIESRELYNIGDDPGQQKNVIGRNPEIAARLQKHYDQWWSRVEPRLDHLMPVVVGSDHENPVLVSACEWVDVFLDQSSQVRRGERKNGVWRLEVAREGDYEIALRRWPRDCDAAIASGVPEHKAEDGQLLPGVAIPVAKARLKVGAFDRTIDVGPEDREAVFRMRLPAGQTQMQSWFLDGGGQALLGAYYAYVERLSGRSAAPAVRVVFDTDILGDVDDVGAVATLHALERRGEAQILAMGVCSRGPASPLCLDALNTYFGRPEIPIGVNKGEGLLKESRYNGEIAARWPHKLASADQAPEAVGLYRRILAAQPDGSLTLVSVGQLSNISGLLKSGGDRHTPLNGVDLVRKKVRLWVCMGGRFPAGREANLWNHAAAAQHAVAAWPGRIVFAGWEVGNAVMTGGKAVSLPAASPVRRAYELYNGGKPRQSWDQVAVLYGVRCVEEDRGYWTLSSPGVCVVAADGSNTWRDDPRGRHQYLLPRRAPRDMAALIEGYMMELPGKA
jgi:arylsulfatase